MIQRTNPNFDYICNLKAKIIKMGGYFATIPKPLIEAKVLHHLEEYLIEVYDENNKYLFKDELRVIKGAGKHLFGLDKTKYTAGKIYWFKVIR